MRLIERMCIKKKSRTARCPVCGKFMDKAVVQVKSQIGRASIAVGSTVIAYICVSAKCNKADNCSTNRISGVAEVANFFRKCIR